MIEENNIPDHWEMKTVGDIAEVVYGDGLPERDRNGGDVPVYGSGGVSGYHNNSLEDGPVVILGRKGSINEVHYVDDSFWAIDTTYYVDTEDGVDTKYVYHFFEAFDLERLDASGTIPSLRKGDVVDLDIPVPPLEEQARIVREIEERLNAVEALEQSVQFVNTHAKEYESSLLAFVLAGRQNIDSNPLDEAPDSEDLPQGWSMVELQEISEVNSGDAFSKDYQGHQDKPIPFYKVGDMNNSFKYMGESNNYVDAEIINALGASTYPEGSIIFPKIGEAIHTNKKRILSEYSAIDNNVMCVNPDEEQIRPEYLYSVFENIDLGRFTRKTTVPSIRLSDIREHKIPLPPLKRQEDILATVNELDVELVHSSIEGVETYLKEYRKSVLSHAFQGEY